MNRIAEYVYKVATSNGGNKLGLSLLGTVFWYGAVALMVFLSPWLDRVLGLKLTIPPRALIVGIILFIIGMPMVIWTILRFFRARGTPVPFNPPPVLVTDGLYAHIRNPMHLGWTLVLAGLGILRQSFSLLVILTPIFLLVHILYLKLVEEQELEKKFGMSYREYKKMVGMFLPKLMGNPKH
jgi:protein-S-isoprenylcysteine O-methyltransferase Ste14